VGNKDLPLGPGSAHAAAFERCGWTVLNRRGRGKHFLLSHPAHNEIISIPDHPEVKRALLAQLVKIAGLTSSEYAKLYRGKR
jgi:predicted RNA binding protein YcfA (HicA-like mRNA interferase family)